MPRPVYLDGTPAGFQSDERLGFIRTNLTLTAHVQTILTDTNHSAEYWVLLNGYDSTANPPNLIGHVQTPEDFANILDRKTWNSTSTLIVCSVEYYDATFPNTP